MARDGGRRRRRTREDREGHVVLVGLMGSGKSAVGRRVAERLDRAFVDSDDLVEAATGRRVAELFSERGEEGFRLVEGQVIADAMSWTEPTVVATGGGAVLDPSNRELMAGAGTVVWLDAPVEVLAQRVGRRAGRPLLGVDPLRTLRELAEERQEAYAECADHMVDASGDLTQVVDRTMAALQGSRR